MERAELWECRLDRERKEEQVTVFRSSLSLSKEQVGENDERFSSLLRKKNHFPYEDCKSLLRNLQASKRAS